MWRIFIFAVKAIGSVLIGGIFIETCHWFGWYPEQQAAKLIVSPPPSEVVRLVLWTLILSIGIFLLFIERWLRLLPFSLSSFMPFQRIAWEFGDYVTLSSSRHSIGTSEDIMLYSDPEYRINQFQVKGNNNSKKPIDDVRGYIRSDKTNKKIPILLEGRPPDQTHGVPGKCEFWVRAIFPKSTSEKEGYTIEDFWRHFGKFTFVFEYDGKRYKKRFKEKQIEKLIRKQKQRANASLIPEDKPRVKIKTDVFL